MNPILPKYRPDIDGIRAIAVIAVIFFHAFPEFIRGGFIGVDIFFTISGFLISTIIFENLNSSSFSFLDFYARRIRRIFPALLIVLISCYTIGYFILLDDEYKQLSRSILCGAGFTSNFMLWHDAGYFDSSSDTKPLLHLWSLSIEEQFYLVWPLLLWAAWKKKFNLLATTSLIALISFYLNAEGVDKNTVATFYSPQTRFWELLCGSILAWVALYKRDAYLEATKNLANILAFSGIFFLTYGFYKINKDLNFPGIWALIPVLGTILIIAAGPRAWLNRVILSNSLLVKIGLISFPLYLWHWPLLSFLRIIGIESAATNIAAILLSIALAWLTYKTIECPIRFGKNSKLKTFALVILMVSVGYVGYHTYRQDHSKTLNNNLKQLINHPLENTERCKANHPYATSICYESEKKYQDSILLIGDSHMEVMALGFKKLFENGDLKYNLLAIGMPGCNPFMNVESVTNKGSDFGCRNIITPALNEAAQHHEIKWVILVGIHAARFSGYPFGNVEKNLENESAPRITAYRYSNLGKTSLVPADTYKLGLTETIQKLVRAKKKIIFAHQMPEMGFNPRHCLSGINKLFRTVECSVPRNIAEARLDPYKFVTRKIIGKYSNVIEYDPMNLVCDQNICTPFNAAGELMYRDDNHMSVIASDYLAREIVKILHF